MASPNSNFHFFRGGGVDGGLGDRRLHKSSSGLNHMEKELNNLYNNAKKPGNNAQRFPDSNALLHPSSSSSTSNAHPNGGGHNHYQQKLPKLSQALKNLRIGNLLNGSSHGVGGPKTK